MLRRLFAVSFVVLWAGGAVAADPVSGITGLFLTTKYPGLTVRAGETTTIDLSLRNFKLPPESLTLSVPEVANGWKATILGGGAYTSRGMAYLAVDFPGQGGAMRLHDLHLPPDTDSSTDSTRTLAIRSASATA